MREHLSLLIILCLATASSFAAPGDGVKLKQVGEAKLVVQPTCPVCDGGILNIYFRNDSTASEPLYITVDQTLEDAAGNPTQAHVSRVLIDPTTGREYDETKENALAANAMLLVRVTVANIQEEGEWKAKVYNRGVEIATFYVYRYHSPFNVKLDVPKPDQPELTFERRTFEQQKSLRIPLRNEDAYSYRLRLELLVKGTSAISPEVTVPPKGSIVAELTFPHGKTSWFNHTIQGKFKDETAEGRLILTQLPVQEPCRAGECAPLQVTNQGAPAANPTVPPETGSGAPGARLGAAVAPSESTVPHADDAASKVIPVTVHLKYYDQPEQYFYIGLLLLFGALCSLVLNAYLPNQVQRTKLKNQLQSLASRIRGLPIKLASRVRVSLGLEARQCHDLLAENLVINPRFSEVLADVNPRVDRLAKRLGLAEDLGRLRMRFEIQREHSLFPTPMTIIRTEFEQADNLVRQLEFNEDYQTQTELLVKSLGTQIDNVEDIDKFYANQHDQVDQITTRARLLLLEGPDTPPAAGSLWPPEDQQRDGQKLYERMYYQVFELWRRSHLPAEMPQPALGPPDKPTDEEKKDIYSAKDLFLREDLPDADRLTTKMRMLRECARLLEGATHLPNLAKLLVSQNAEKFEAASRLLEQIKEKVYSSDAWQEMTTGVAPERIRMWRDWGGHAIWRKVFSVFVVLFWILAIFVTSLFAIKLAREESFGALVFLLFLLAAVLGALAVLGDPLMRCANLADWQSEKADPHRVSDRCRQIWTVDRKKVRIDLGTNEVRVFEPVQLRVKFCREVLNFDDVLEDITPLWDFDHDDLAHEEGWEVVHYFPRERKYNVRVKFQKREGGFLTNEAVVDGPPQLEDPFVHAFKEIEAKPLKRGAGVLGAAVDVIWVLVALIPALAVLFTGAIDQLNKVDFMPAIIAIFGLGFASDQVKNLIQKSQ